MNLFLATFALAVVCIATGPAHAHELKLDDNGCHRDGAYGKYHCHEGDHAGDSFVSADDYPGTTDRPRALPQGTLVKKNSSGVCVTPDNDLYNRQKNYRTFQSVEQCLRYGGHLDKTLVLRQ